MTSNEELQALVDSLNSEANVLAYEGQRLQSIIEYNEEYVSNIVPPIINMLGDISKLPFLTKNMRLAIECAKIDLKYLLPLKPDYRLFELMQKEDWATVPKEELESKFNEALNSMGGEIVWR